MERDFDDEENEEGLDEPRRKRFSRSVRMRSILDLNDPVKFFYFLMKCTVYVKL